MKAKAETIIREMARRAEITINGDKPWDIKVHNPALYERVLKRGNLGLGEAYMEGWWSCNDLDGFFRRILSVDLRHDLPLNIVAVMAALRATLMNQQSLRRAFVIGRHHYDWGNDLYQEMLDPYMAYSCGYWDNASDLGAAQEAKLDLVCRKLGLEPGMRLLDIGCGWGSLLRFAAERYGVTGLGVTVSGEQADLARELCRGLPVTIWLGDYRSLSGRFDRIASIGMFEHVGYRNYPTYMQVAARNLEPGGLFLLHSIFSNVSVRVTDPWISKYIFPNSMLPSIAQVGSSIERKLIAEDWHNLGPNYSPTLRAWHENLITAWPELSKHDAVRYSEWSRRMWEYYLCSCAALFAVRQAQVWQIVLSRQGEVERYRSVR